MAGISLTNKEEELSAMPLEDKDNQGELEFTSPMYPTHQPIINKNQERLMEQEHAIVRILISRIGWCKEKLKAKRGPAQWT